MIQPNLFGEPLDTISPRVKLRDYLHEFCAEVGILVNYSIHVEPALRWAAVHIDPANPPGGATADERFINACSFMPSSFGATRREAVDDCTQSKHFQTFSAWCNEKGIVVTK